MFRWTYSLLLIRRLILNMQQLGFGVRIVLEHLHRLPISGTHHVVFIVDLTVAYMRNEPIAHSPRQESYRAAIYVVAAGSLSPSLYIIDHVLYQPQPQSCFCYLSSPWPRRRRDGHRPLGYLGRLLPTNSSSSLPVTFPPDEGTTLPPAR